MNFEITDNAYNRVAYLMQKENASGNKDKAMLGLRVSVDGGGCSGFMYNYELVDNISVDDLVIEKSIKPKAVNANNYNEMEGKFVKIIVDPISCQFLKGCTLDFIEELGASYFQIINPAATAKCGCGNSFAI